MTDENYDVTEDQDDAVSIYDAFGTDRNMERSGIWLDYGKFGKILIARAGGANSRFAKVLEHYTRPYRRQIEGGTMDSAEADKLLMQAFADAVVIKWEGIKDRKGNLMPFNKENVVTLFTDLPDLFADVREQAMKAANFRALELEVDSGN